MNDGKNIANSLQNGGYCWVEMYLTRLKRLFIGGHSISLIRCLVWRTNKMLAAELATLFIITWEQQAVNPYSAEGGPLQG